MQESLSRAKILVVDDVVGNVLALRLHLRAEYEVLAASGGLEALRLACDEQPDLILLDVMMPEIDGYETCRRLKAQADTAEIPVIFVTACDDSHEEQQGFSVGAVDYITKPFNAPVVKARVRTHVELKRQRDLLRTLSFMDGLTGLANRRRFDECLALEWKRCARMEEPLSVIMIDVDHFKRFNDHYGHQAGDDCLRQVAGAVACQVNRPGDLVARYGGEEMVCLLSQTDLEGARRVAERISAAVAELAIPHADSPTAATLTLSQGIACRVPARDTPPEPLIEEADGRLYEAKAAGRNAVFG
ncbi:diguanylate cyclase domain-containing protein [Endothiovibrio diazotrophicus]